MLWFLRKCSPCVKQKNNVKFLCLETSVKQFTKANLERHFKYAELASVSFIPKKTFKHFPSQSAHSVMSVPMSPFSWEWSPPWPMETFKPPFANRHSVGYSSFLFTFKEKWLSGSLLHSKIGPYWWIILDLVFWIATVILSICQAIYLLLKWKQPPIMSTKQNWIGKHIFNIGVNVKSTKCTNMYLPTKIARGHSY